MLKDNDPFELWQKCHFAANLMWYIYLQTLDEDYLVESFVLDEKALAALQRRIK